MQCSTFTESIRIPSSTDKILIRTAIELWELSYKYAGQVSPDELQGPFVRGSKMMQKARGDACGALDMCSAKGLRSNIASIHE